MITLNKILLDQIKYEATTSYPSECCGLLVGQNYNQLDKITRVIPTKNILRSQGNDCFEIDPQDRITLERELRGEQDSVIGHFHSHPNNTHIPSKRDIDLAFEPKMIWLIVSVVDGKFRDFGAYRLNKNKREYTTLSSEVIIETV